LKCPFCEEETDSSLSFCSHCGARMTEEVISAPSDILSSTDSVPASAPVTPVANAFGPGAIPGSARADGSLPSGNSPADLAKVKGFNVGAFVFGFIWCFGNGLPQFGVAALFGGMFGASIIVNILLGLAGNELLWRNVHFNSVYDFREQQDKWHKAAILLVGIIVALVLLNALSVMLRVVSK
jgi:hypothetical protein